MGGPCLDGGDMGVPTQEVERQVGEHGGGGRWGCPGWMGKRGRYQPGWGDMAGPSLKGEDTEGPSLEGGARGPGRGQAVPVPPPGAVPPRPGPPSPPRLPAGPAPLRRSPRPGHTGAAINAAAAAVAGAVRGAEPSGERGRPGKRGGSRGAAPRPAPPHPRPAGDPAGPHRPGGGGQPRAPLSAAVSPQAPDEMSSLRSPPRGTKDREGAATLRYPAGAGKLPASAGGAPPVPAAPLALRAGPNLLASVHLQKLNSRHRAAGGLRRSPEPGSPPGWSLGTQPRGAGSRPPAAAGPGIIDSDPVDEEVLRALVLELGLDVADELPELWLGHHEFDFPADLPAGC